MPKEKNKKTPLSNVRTWLEKQIVSGKLKPGAKLPSIKELMEMFDISYMTVSRILAALSQEGLIETRRGSGSYLCGNKPLTVLICIASSMLPFERFHELLKQYTEQAELKIEFEFCCASAILDPDMRREIQERYAAVLSTSYVNENLPMLPPALLSQFPDYRKVMADLKPVPGHSYDYALPFLEVVYQMGVNKKLLSEVGYEPEQLTGDFLWWEDFVRKCREKHLTPASMEYTKASWFLIQSFFSLLLTLLPYSREKYEGEEPMFNTLDGERFFRIVDEIEFLTPESPASRNFYQNGAVLSFSVGSWITVQNHALSHPEKAVDHLGIVAYRNQQGEKIVLVGPSSLRAFFRHDIRIDEKKRVWELMKIMVSREFQIALCSETGNVSPNRQVQPSDYRWNITPDAVNFIPGDSDHIFYDSDLFALPQKVMLSIFLENYSFFNAPLKETLQRMDIKKVCKNLYK